MKRTTLWGVCWFLTLFWMPLVWGKQSVPKKSSKSTPATIEPERRFRQANQDYNKGLYAKALKGFHQLGTKTGWRHFAVLFNIGNCYVQIQDYGRALAYYLKAKQLKPNHRNLLHNIQLLKKRMGKSKSQSSSGRLKVFFWYYLLNIGSLFWLLFLCLCLTCVIWAFHLRANAGNGGMQLQWLGILLFFFTVILGFSFGLKYKSERIDQSGIVLPRKISARSGYGKSFEPIFLLRQGDRVSILEKRDKWLRVKINLQDDKSKTWKVKTGWIPAQALLDI